jgi:hypothetical protein
MIRPIVQPYGKRYRKDYNKDLNGYFFDFFPKTMFLILHGPKDFFSVFGYFFLHIGSIVAKDK